MITLCFDCEKNLPIPKVPDQIAYYSRQLYLYNFTVTQGCSKDELNKDTVFAYTWMEDQYKEGSNEISSAIVHRLSNTDYTGKTKVRLVADSCVGQNKNTAVLSASSIWLLKKAPKTIETVELVFPVTGHSYIPPDRVFGNRERTQKKRHNIEPRKL